jgi:hypothetical protein
VRPCVRVRSRAGADDARVRGMCASAARSLRKAIHRWNTHGYSMYIPAACMYLHPCASSYTDERIADAGPPHTRAHVLRSVRARVCACDRARTHLRRHLRAPSVGVDRGWLGSQAFQSASAFNANICAWNTAAVTSLAYVCAALSGPGGAPPQAGRARRVIGAARAVVRGGAADARARVCAPTCGHAHARVSPGVGIAARSIDGIYDCMSFVHICLY